MIINDSFLTGSEYISLVLRNYYSENGYNLIKLNKFEEYDFSIWLQLCETLL